MSIRANGRLAVSIAFLILFITIPALLSRTSTAATQAESRDVEDNIPKHLPVAVHLRPEKERAAKDMKNEKWVRDFELEVKNTGDKPIYFIRFGMVPDLGKPPTEPTVGLTLEYGRDDLVDFNAPLTPEDVPIKPGEKVFIKIREQKMDGWDHFRKVENWPENWSRPKKVSLYFEILNFGDGTGFDGGGGTPHERQKPQAALSDLTAQRRNSGFGRRWVTEGFQFTASAESASKVIRLMQKSDIRVFRLAAAAYVSGLPRILRNWQ